MLMGFLWVPVACQAWLTPSPKVCKLPKFLVETQSLSNRQVPYVRIANHLDQSFYHMLRCNHNTHKDSQGRGKITFIFLLFTCRPTPNMLLTFGKRVIVFGSQRIVNDSIFPDVSVPSWDKDTVKYFTSYPECGGYSAGQWYTMGGESFVVGSICK